MQKGARFGLPLAAASVGAFLLLFLIGSPPAHAAPTFPAGFDDRVVTSGVNAPMGLAFTPDGRMLIVGQLGTLHVYEDGALVSPPALDITAMVCASTERGVQSVAVDPDFALNRFIYIFYTFKKFGECPYNTVPGANDPVNRVSRFILRDDNVVDPASETVLIDNIPTVTVHMGGDLHFGKDGNLYASTGDGGCDYAGGGCQSNNNASRDLHALVGKVLRITPSGGIPADNPFQGPGTGRCNIAGRTTPGTICQETYAWGLRNPWRLAFDGNAAGTRFFINDVGWNSWEEIDLGQAGADFGWNVREGPCANGSTTDCGPPPAGMTNPTFAYGRTEGCGSVVGGAFVPLGGWRPEDDGAYLYGDYVCGKMFALTGSEQTGFTSTVFASGFGYGLTHMMFGPSEGGQALYWINYLQDAVHRLTFPDGNRAPVASATADETYGDLPLAVNFDGTASTDPDDDPITFEWDFGDGSPTATGPTASHTYTSAQNSTATLTVRDNRGGVDTATIDLYPGDHPPVPVIEAPTADKRFRVGEEITLSGSASDPEEGALSDVDLTWEAIRHHSNTHTHPYLPPTVGNDVPLVGPPPEDLLSTTDSHVEFFLTATDSRGLSATVSQDLLPKLVDVTFETEPDGLHVQAAGTTFTGPSTVASWDNYDISVNAPNQTDALGRFWLFRSWSDGGARAHTIATPSAPASYTARFTPAYPRPNSATPLRVPLVPAFSACTTPSMRHIEPLALPSCNPSLESSLLKIGKIGQGSGHARFAAIHGDASTPADEADLSIAAIASDVRSAGGGLDYVGNLILRATLRMTDFGSGPFEDESATVSDLDFSIPMACAATSELSGATCSLSTSADTIVPGFAKEGERAVISARSVAVLDLGPDESMAPTSGTCPPTCGSGDEATFLHQGLFTP